MNTNLIFSTVKDDWQTPINLFRELDAEFHFTVDLCASDTNHLCDKYYTKDMEINGLNCDLAGEIVFCNPPYGKQKTLQWVKRCFTCNAKTVVMLIPARTDTRAFHDYILNKAEIRFIRGRLSFGGGNKAPFPSMIVIYRNNEDLMEENKAE